MVDPDKDTIEDALETLQDEKLGFEHETEEETEEDTESREEEKPFDAEKIRVDQKMLSLKYIKELLEGGKLNLSPGFQRHKVWTDNKRKSLLIESLMLRIPIPAFYFYEDDDSNYSVIDGLQRLSTIEEFLDGKFKLSGLQYLKDTCGDLKFSDLPAKYVNRIHQTQLAVNVIDARTPPKVKYDIFRRINTGGIPLNAQEIRNSVAQDRVRNFLKKLVASDAFIQVTGGVNDLRMGAQELVLRFVAFEHAYDSGSKQLDYDKGELEAFLDAEFNRLNKMSQKELREYETLFCGSMGNAYALFGQYAFRRADLIEEGKRPLLNRALFTSWSVLLADADRDRRYLAQKQGQMIQVLADELRENPNYLKAVTVSTGDVRQIQTNFATSRLLMERVLGNK